MIIGVIGYKNHSDKIIKILEKNFFVKNIIVFCRNKIILDKLNANKSKKTIYSSNLLDLNNSSGIFVLSPPSTHKDYIQILRNYKGYIFCEKPPCVNLSELNYLKKINLKRKKRILFNYNFLNSNFKNKIISLHNNKKMGKPIIVIIKASHGIAFSKKLQSWRFYQKNIFENIAGNLGIHYIELLVSLYGSIKTIEIKYGSYSNKKIIDTAIINCTFKNKINSIIFLSYASVYSNSFEFIYTNSKIKFEKNILSIFSPRDTFDKIGNFCSPKPKKIIINNLSFHNSLLHDSVDFFINSIRHKKNFIKLYNHSLSICEIFINKNKNFLTQNNQ